MSEDFGSVITGTGNGTGGTDGTGGNGGTGGKGGAGGACAPEPTPG